MKPDWNIISAVAALLAAMAAFAAIYLQGRWMRRSTSLELNWRAEEQFFRNDSMLEKRRIAGAALLKNEIVPEVWKILDFFETIGLLVRQGVLDKEIVYSNFHNRAIAYWHACEEHIRSERIRYKSDTLWLEFQELVRILDAMRRKKTRLKIQATIPQEAIYERLLDESRAS